MAVHATTAQTRDIAPALARLTALLPTAADQTTPAPPILPPAPTPHPETPPASGQECPPRGETPAGETDDRIRALSIPAAELDILVDRVGELGIAQARLASLSLRRGDLELRDVAEEVERLAGLLRDQVLGLRMALVFCRLAQPNPPHTSPAASTTHSKRPIFASSRCAGFPGTADRQ